MPNFFVVLQFELLPEGEPIPEPVLIIDYNQYGGASRKDAGAAEDEELFGGEGGLVAPLMRDCDVDDGDESGDGAPPQSAHSSQLSSH